MDSQSRKPVFTARFPIRWGDMDAYGHVNNTLHFRYAEQARSEWLQQVFGDQRPLGQGVVLAHASCHYLRPLTYPGMLEVLVSAAKPGRSSLMTYFEIRKEGEDTLYAEGNCKIVWMDFIAGKPVPLPDALRRQVE